MAVVWSQPSEFSSDLWAAFYDPLFQVWGKPKQLTEDSPIVQLASGLFQITIQTANNQSLTLEASADLIAWGTILETNSVNSAIQWIDPDSRNLPWRFYRSKAR